MHNSHFRRRTFLAGSGAAAAIAVGGNTFRSARRSAAAPPVTLPQAADPKLSTVDPLQPSLQFLGAGNGVIYVVRADGDLLWYRHTDWQGGGNSWAPGSGRRLGTGWHYLSWIGAGFDGTIFGLTPDGKMWRYKYVTTDLGSGAGYWAVIGQQIGSGWTNLSRVFGGPDNILYIVRPGGDLHRLQYFGSYWTSAQIGSGWQWSGILGADGDGNFYAESFAGSIGIWRWKNGWANSGAARSIDHANFQNLSDLFLGGQGVFYFVPYGSEIPPHPNLLQWARLTNWQTAANDGPRWSGTRKTVGAGWVAESSAALMGYTPTFSVRPLETAKFCVSTTYGDALETAVVRASVAEGEFPVVWGPSTLPPQLQLLPPDHTVNGCNWQVNVAVPVPATWPSGVYALRVLHPKGFGCYIPFIVKPAAPAAAIAVLLPSNTYHAYNSFGAYGQYTPGGVLQPRQLSFDRPNGMHAIVYGGGLAHEMESDMLLIRWMLQQGLSFDVYEDRDLERDPGLPLSYPVFVLGTHPEYQTHLQRNALITYTANGGRLISTGGNAIWDLITYSTDLTKGTFRDNAGNRQEFHRSGYPPSQVLGTSYNENGWGSFAPFRVRNAGHWALAGTGLDDGDTFGEAGLSGPASGWEFDVLFGNEGEPKPEHIIAVGTNPVPGGGAVMSVTPRGTDGGWVFAASSLTFNGSLPEDEVCSRILHNVFDRALSAGPNGQRYSGPISPRPNVTQVSPPAVASHIPDVPSSDEREGGLRHRWIT